MLAHIGDAEAQRDLVDEERLGQVEPERAPARDRLADHQVAAAIAPDEAHRAFVDVDDARHLERAVRVRQPVQVDAHGARRGWLQRLAGSGEKVAQAKRDAETLRLRAENRELHGKVDAMQDRLVVLEKIVTDRGYTLAQEIEALRDAPAIGKATTTTERV